MHDIYCTCGYGLWNQDEINAKEWQTPLHPVKTNGFVLETCPHCGAPIGIYLVR